MCFIFGQRNYNKNNNGNIQKKTKRAYIKRNPTKLGPKKHHNIPIPHISYLSTTICNQIQCSRNIRDFKELRRCCQRRYTCKMGSIDQSGFPLIAWTISKASDIRWDFGKALILTSLKATKIALAYLLWRNRLLTHPMSNPKPFTKCVNESKDHKGSE